MTAYVLDGTGTSVDNLVTDEQIDNVVTLGVQNPVVVFPQFAPFYIVGLIVSYTGADGNSKTLVKGTDFEPIFEIKGVVANNSIFGGIVLTNRSLNGVITLQYQTLGGNWDVNKAKIAEDFDGLVFNPRMGYLTLKPWPDMFVDGVDTPIVLDSLVGLENAQNATDGGVVTLTCDVAVLSDDQKLIDAGGGLTMDGANRVMSLTIGNAGGLGGGGGTGDGTGGTGTNYALESGGNLAALANSALQIQASSASSASSASTMKTSLTSIKTNSDTTVTNTAAAVTALQDIQVKAGHIDTATAAAATSTATTATQVTAAAASLVSLDNKATTRNASLADIDTQVTTSATQTTALATAVGTKNDATWTGTGLASLMALTKAIATAVMGALNIRALSSATDSVTTVPSGTQAVSSSQLPASLGQKSSAGSISVAVAADQGPLGVTSTGGALALDASIQTLITAVKNTVSMDGTIWVDATAANPVYYVRREIETQQSGVYSIVWENLDGTTASPTVSNLKAVGDVKGLTTENVIYTATAGGTGYVSGDILIHAFGLNTTTVPVTVAYSTWFNAGPSVANGTILSAPPTGGTYAQATQAVAVTSAVLATNAAQETGGNLAAVAANTLAASNDLGTTSDAAWTGSGNGTVNGILKAMFGKLAGALNIRNLSSATDSVTVQGGNTLAVKTDGSAVTQPVSATALPLPTGAAKENGGHLAAVDTSTASIDTKATAANASLASIDTKAGTIATNTAPGTAATGVTMPTGGVGMLGWLSAIFSRLTGGVDYVIASDGVLVPVDSLAQTYAWTSGQLTSITVVYQTKTYVQTLVYGGSGGTQVQSQSQWVLQ